MSIAAVIRPELCAMCGNVCGMVCAVKSLIFKVCAPCALSPFTGVQAGACTHMHAGVRMCVHVHGAHSAHSAHLIHINHLRAYVAAQHAALHSAHLSTPPFLKEIEMEEEKKRVIPCTPENAAEVRAAVKAWPQLQSLVKSLQDGGHFPGLRAMTFTLTGSAEFVGKGLGALLRESRAAAPQTGEEA